MNARLHQMWSRVQRAAHTVADFQARLILSVLYALFIVPVGLYLRFNGDPLQINEPARGSTLWNPRPATPADLRRARRQF